MSAEAAKRRIKNNKKIVTRWIGVIAGVNGAVLGVSLPFGLQMVTPTNLFTLLIELAILGLLRRLATPTVIRTKKQLEIKYEGADLTGRGLTSILQDVLYVSLLVKLLRLFFKKAWLAFMLIPASIYYEIFLKQTGKKKPSAGGQQ